MSPDEREGLASASEMHRLNACPGSRNLIRQCPPQPSGEDADRGTALHAHLAAQARVFFGLEPSNDPLPKLSPQEEETKEACWDLFYGTYMIWREGIGRPELSPQFVAIEERLWITKDGRKLTSAKMDVAVMVDFHVFIADFKTGRGDVAESPDNLQLRTGVAAVAQRWNPEDASVVIIQPWVTRNPIVTKYDSESLDQAFEHIRGIVLTSEKPDAQRHEGEWCKYCNGRPFCEEAKGSLAVATVPVLELNPIQISTLLDRCNLAEDVIAGIRNHAKQLLAAGVEVPGWELKPGKSVRTLPDAEAAFNAVQGVVSVEDFTRCCKVGITDLSAVLKKSTGLKGKAFDAKVDELLGPVIEMRQNAEVLSQS